MIPLGAAGVLREFPYVGCYGGHDLGSATAVADNCDLLPGVVKTMVPLGRVEDPTLKAIHSRESTSPGLRKAAYGREEYLTCLRKFLARGLVEE